jgi:hypothetical protein
MAMFANLWNWWAYTDAGLASRIALGVLLLTGLAVWDIRRNGRSAQRWREYLFLLAAVVVAMIYGVVNDQITVGISWEYFYHGKELHKVLGPAEPPAQAALRWEAAKVGMKATWTAGLLIGAAMLIANNPRRGRPRLGYRTLLRLAGMVFVMAGAFGAAGGLAGHAGLLSGIGGFDVLVAADLWRPARFMAVWGIHLGGYVGGGLGAAAAVWRIIVLRRRGAVAASLS